MEPQQIPTSMQKSAFNHPQQPSPKSFKPIISIPIITVPPKQPLQSLQPLQNQFPQQFAEKQRNSDQTLTEELRAKKLFHQYLQCLRQNKMLKTTLQHVQKQKQELKQKYTTLQNREKTEIENKKKRHRRNANQIVRSYQCPVQNCDKSYGAQASLTQHIKLKHYEYYSMPEFQRFIVDLNRKNRDQSSLEDQD